MLVRELLQYTLASVCIFPTGETPGLLKFSEIELLEIEFLLVMSIAMSPIDLTLFKLLSTRRH